MISNREIALPPYTRACLQECKAHDSPPMPDRYPQGIKDTLFNCNDPPRSLLMLTNIIYNHVSTGRGRFYRLEVGGLTSIEEHTNHTF